MYQKIQSLKIINWYKKLSFGINICSYWIGSFQMVYCFICLSQQTGALQEATALRKPTTIVNIRANENAMTQ